MYSGACSSDDAQVRSSDAGEGDDASAGLARVAYEPHVVDDPYEPLAGGPTDEALSAVLSAKPIQGSAKAAIISSPAGSAVLARRAPPSFEWRAVQALRVRAQPSALLARAPLPIGPEHAARAHNPPFSGTVFLFQISTPKTRGAFRLFTAGTAFTPDVALWARLVADGGPLTVDLRTARLTDNRVDADGGPFDAAQVVFAVST